MTEDRRFPPSDQIASGSHCNWEKYKKLYQESLEDPDNFWAKQAERLVWYEKWTKVKNISFKKPVEISWFVNGKLNVSFNCIDRHLIQSKDRLAIIWEPDEPGPARKISYGELYDEVCRMANVLRNHGVKKGDRVTIYLPMIPEAVFAMLACTRIGAVHSVIFAGFSPDSIADRIIDGKSDFVITSDEGVRGGKKIPLKANIDEALEKVLAKSLQKIRKVLIIERTKAAANKVPGRDIFWSEERLKVGSDSSPEAMDSEDPLFLLYTSGSTNKPKGVLHSTAGYLLFASLTHELVFDYRPGEVYFCTADVGWVTGHSYLVYGPLANAATILMFEGIPTYPTPSRLWEIVDKHSVSVLYTAPTALRALMREGDLFVKKTSRRSLRILGTVGEPINPEAWIWYHDIVGEKRCPVIDTWWQTETGGILISPLPGATTLKPGSATLPFFGIQPAIVSAEGKVLERECEGGLCIADSWPGQMRTVFGDHSRFEETYFSTYPGFYFTGDGAKRDADGYYWITGRVDDVINVAGHRLGTAEIESALVSNTAVAEAAVVGFPHDIKGQGIYAFVTLKAGVQATEELRKQLIAGVRKEISAIASPDIIQWAQGLPKTRSGKIMRRILRKIAEGQNENIGDTTTLADPSVVQELVSNRTALARR